MKTKQLLITGMFIFGGLSSGVYAQNNTVAAGGNATGSGGSVSFSVGQIDYITATGSGGTANQGVQQPYEIYVSTGIDVKEITLDFVVYPNPTIDNITLKVSGSNYGKLNFNILSLDGKLLRSEELMSEATIINMGEFAQGLYIINVYNNEKTIKSFNVIKK